MSNSAANGPNPADKTGKILRIRDLKISYQTQHGMVNIVNGVSIHVSPGEKIALVGESGCGKTQTVRSVLQILPSTVRYPSGEILFHDLNLLAANPDQLTRVRQKGISMIYQEPSAVLNPLFTVGRQIMDVIRYSADGKISKAEQKHRALEIIEQVKIPDPERIFRYYPHQLSGGMRQRICIAMALATPRELLIADEPGTALDVTIQKQVNALMTRMVEERRMAMILVTHSLAVAREMTDRIYVMYAGTVVETATTKELFRKQYHPYTTGLLSSIPKLTGEGIADGIPGHVPDYANMPSGCRFCPRCPYADERCRKEAPIMTRVSTDHFAACHRLSEEN